MSELGRLLVEAREAKKLSLADVEAATRVRQKYLEALEQGNYGILPPGAIARGFLRNYARFLELDPVEVLRLYSQESGDTGPAPVASGNRQARPVDYRPLEVTLMKERGDGSAWRWVLALLLVAALVAGAWWALNNTSWARTITPSTHLAALAPQRTRPAAAAPAAGASRTPTAPAARPSASPSASPQPSYTVTPPADPGTALPALSAPAQVAANPGDTQGASGQPTPSPTSDLLTLPIPTAQPTATPVPTATPTPTPEAVAGISLTLRITQRSWVKVTADDQVVMQDLLEAGQERSWPAQRQITILTGNAGGTTLSLNGQDLGAMGTVGQVVERTWVVEQDKVSEVAPNRPTATPGP